VDVVRHSLPDNVHQLHVQTTFHVWKTRGCQCSFRLLMMGGVSSEICWASYKYGIIKFWYIVASCWILFMNCTMMHGSTNIMFQRVLIDIGWARKTQWVNTFFKNSIKEICIYIWPTLRNVTSCRSKQFYYYLLDETSAIFVFLRKNFVILCRSRPCAAPPSPRPHKSLDSDKQFTDITSVV